MSSNSSRCIDWARVAGAGGQERASKGSTRVGRGQETAQGLARVRAAIRNARRGRYLRDVLDVDGPVFELWVSGDQAAVRGECDRSVVEALEAWLATLAQSATVTVDLSRVTFLSAAAARALVNARRDISGLCFVAPSAAVRRMLELTGNQSLLDDCRRNEFGEDKNNEVGDR
jgi:anti-anti-sigma factor